MKDNQSKDSEAESAPQFHQNLQKTIISRQNTMVQLLSEQWKTFIHFEDYVSLFNAGHFGSSEGGVQHDMDLDLHVSVESFVG